MNNAQRRKRILLGLANTLLNDIDNGSEYLYGVSDGADEGNTDKENAACVKVAHAIADELRRKANRIK